MAPPLTVDASETGTNTHIHAQECAQPRVSNPSPHAPHPHPRLRALLLALSRFRSSSDGLGGVEWPVRMRDANGVVCEVGMGGSIDVRSGPSGMVGFRRKKVVPSHLEIVRKPLCNHQLPYGCNLRTKKLPVEKTIC